MSFDIYTLVTICGASSLALGIILFVILYQRRVINHQIELREFNRRKEIELLQASIRSEEEERKRIASELHDDVGATLSSIGLFLHQVSRNSNETDLIDRAKGLLDVTIQKVRDISHQLQPSSLNYLGLQKSLQSLAELIDRTGTVQMEMLQENVEWQDPTDPQISLSVYRIVQELVNNIIKHAGASWIRVQTHSSGSKRLITLSHNGYGLTQVSYQEQLYKKNANGLKNIESRLKSSSTSIDFSEIGGIYRIILHLPSNHDTTDLNSGL